MNDTMKPIKKLSQQIETKRKDIDGMRRDLARCETTIQAAGRHDTALHDLRWQRQKVQAEAFLAKTEPDTAELDRKIEEAEKASADAVRAGEAATTAAGLLKDRIQSAEQELAGLEAERRRSVGAHLSAVFDAALDAYSEHTAALKGALWKARGAADLLRRLGSVTAPARVDAILDQLRNHGLCTSAADPDPDIYRGGHSSGGAILEALGRAGVIESDIQKPYTPPPAPVPPHVPVVQIHAETADGVRVRVSGDPQHTGHVPRQQHTQTEPAPAPITRRLA